jgi:hypothetical protein
MSMSLREQLLQAGFGRKQEKNKQEKNKQERERPPAKPKVDAAQAAKAARAAEAERRRQEQADRKARWDKI